MSYWEVQRKTKNIYRVAVGPLKPLVTDTPHSLFVHLVVLLQNFRLRDEFRRRSLRKFFIWIQLCQMIAWAPVELVVGSVLTVVSLGPL